MQRHLWAVQCSEVLEMLPCVQTNYSACAACCMHAFSEGYGRVTKVVILDTCRKKKRKKEDRKTFFRGQLFIFSVSELKRKSQPKLQLY